MKTRQRTTLFYLCVSIALLQVIEITSINVQIISHTLPFATPLFQDSPERSSPRLVYGICDDNERLYGRNCTLVIETNAPRDSNDRLGFCDISIKSSSIPVNAVNYIYALDENTTIIQWTNNRYRRFAIVHFSDCRIAYPKINDDSKINLDWITAPFNGTFDVIVQDSRKESPCLRGKLCRMIFDVNGNVIEQPRNWIDEGVDIIDIVRTDDRNRLIVDVDYSETIKYVRLYKLYDNGMIKVFKNYPAGNLDASSKKIAVSTTHQLVTICALNYTKLACGQFDYNGVQKLETHFKPMDFPDLHSTKVFNHPNGGFVLLTLKCSSHENITECHSADEKYFTIRIFNATTNLLKSVTIAQLKCGDEFKLDNMHYFDDDNDENFSLSYVCDHRDTDGRVSANVNYFMHNDLDGGASDRLKKKLQREAEEKYREKLRLLGITFD